MLRGNILSFVAPNFGATYSYSSYMTGILRVSREWLLVDLILRMKRLIYMSNVKVRVFKLKQFGEAIWRSNSAQIIPHHNFKNRCLSFLGKTVNCVIILSKCSQTFVDNILNVCG